MALRLSGFCVSWRENRIEEEEEEEDVEEEEEIAIAAL